MRNAHKIEKFRTLANNVCEITKKYDLIINGYNSVDLPLFRSLKEANQSQVLSHLEDLHRSMELTEQSGGKLNDQNRSLWGALRTFNLIPPIDLFAHLQPNSAIEIYDLKSFQIWRNFHAMKYCSYTLEEALSIPVMERYKRPPHIKEECAKNIEMLLTGKTPEVFFPDIKKHLVEESRSRGKLHVLVKHDLLARLRDTNGNLAGWLVASTAELVKDKSSYIDSQIINISTREPVNNL